MAHQHHHHSHSHAHDHAGHSHVPDNFGWAFAVGVTINAEGQAVLDVSAQAGTGQLNFLADNGTGTIVNFIQNAP